LKYFSFLKLIYRIGFNLYWHRMAYLVLMVPLRIYSPTWSMNTQRRWMSLRRWTHAISCCFIYFCEFCERFVSEKTSQLPSTRYKNRSYLHTWLVTWNECIL